MNAQVLRKGVRQVPVPGIWNIKIPDSHGLAVYYRTIRILHGWAAERPRYGAWAGASSGIRACRI